MSIIVSRVSQVIENILHFKEELDGNEALQDRLSYARAWYAHKDEEGKWLFAPSKFVGYRGMTAEEYMNSDQRDGRITERKLAEWFTLLSEEDSLYGELSEHLSAFLSHYDKTPSAAMRINVTSKFYEQYQTDDAVSSDRHIADFIIAIWPRLSDSERRRVRSCLKLG
ncbi:hypothetical protein [Pseudomonas sp.]|uniref:hypothetical protein n=1 Tax=Pseudomonas sp. TaxID=306 RepID=UPI0028A93990|nr:hypothetical protein [Pseudomonas sp.]